MGRRKRTAEEIEESVRRKRLRDMENQQRIRNQRSIHQVQQKEHYAGSMDIKCVHCNAKHFKDEKVSNKGNSFNDCCSHGAVKIDNLPDFPPLLRQLYDINHSKSNKFFDKIRCYNSTFSFASFNANLINFRSRRPGPYCFKIQGQIYYQINTSLYPETNDTPTYGQLFIVDPEEANYHRITRNSEIDAELTQELDQMFRQCNIFAQSYIMMKEEIENQQLNSNNTNNSLVPELQMHFTLKPGTDHRRYNFQRTNEVAAIFTTNADGDIPESYVTIRNKNTRILQQVSTMDPNVEPWVYPIFYPHGSQGWHKNIKRVNSDKRVSRAAYVKYRIAIRDEFNAFLMGRRLFQQWIVDNYVKIEKDRINYCLNNQASLRSETYQGLIDYMANAANGQNVRVGKMIILPSTFIGSPRYMTQLYQDAMAIVRKYGKPDIFITMTCNPNWKEIQENLLPGQVASDRPDIASRVFNVKKNHLIHLVVQKKLFGEVIAYVYVIEFQKRGLPHIHFLVFLKQNNKINNPASVDHFISAEIPDPENDPVLHNIVMKHMIHGPCGEWCLVDNKCSKHFPKEFQNETIMDRNGYPYYKRRNTGASYERPGNFVVNNSNVVPYCPVLSLALNCHINVEIVCTIDSVKYLFKYLYKGHDAATITIEENSEKILTYDEIKQHINSRYVGPCEGFWRITSKPLQEKSHSIIRLPIHLPNEQNITVHVDADEDQLLQSMNQVTMLLDYFALNIRDSEAKQYLYSDIPSHYTFKKFKVNNRNVQRWERRKCHFNCIGRMYSVSPTQVELYHLRLLLLHIKGATSFENLKQINGKQCETYTNACLELGIIENDEEWKRAMQEAMSWMMPYQLRRLFVRILIHCQPLNPENLWDEFKDAMSQDYTQHLPIDIAHKKAYEHLHTILCSEGHSFSEFPKMKELHVIIAEEECRSIEQLLTIGQEKYLKLNKKQKHTVDLILNAIDNNNEIENKLFFIDGPGGSGKTFIYTTLWNLIKGRNKKISTMAFTGIAATLLPGGKTVHKTLGLPVPLYNDSTSNIKINSKEGQFLKDTDVFIWDEAPMSPRYALEVMDRILRDIMNSNLPFGNKIVILGGDFRQLLPIKLHSTRSENVNLSIKFSDLWKYFQVFSLIENMRTLPEEIEFSNFLIDLGDEKLNDSDNNIIIPDKFIAEHDANIVEDVFGIFIRNKQYYEASHCAILSARNIDVNEMNEQVVNLLDEKTERLYTSIDSTENCENDSSLNAALLPEYLNTLNPTSLPPYELRLRLNCVVMLIRNLSISEGLCNGTRLLILELANNLLKCEILTGDKSGDIIFLNRITLYCENEYPFTFKRRQFPIKLAYAMTINKSQGQTFNKIGIDLRRDVFQHGQLYVACSRVRSCNSLKIYLGDDQNKKIVKNYVYKELLISNTTNEQ